MAIEGVRSCLLLDGLKQSSNPANHISNEVIVVLMNEVVVRWRLLWLKMRTRSVTGLGLTLTFAVAAQPGSRPFKWVLRLLLLPVLGFMNALFGERLVLSGY